MKAPDTQIILDFDMWCHRCEHSGKKEHEYPCRECLAKPVSWNSERPAFFKERLTKIS